MEPTRKGNLWCSCFKLVFASLVLICLPLCYIFIQHFLEHSYTVNDSFCNPSSERLQYINGDRTINECNYQSKNWNLLVTVNNGYLDLFTNWLWYFKKLNISVPLHVIAEDDIVFQRLLKIKDNAMKVQRSEFISINSSVEYDTSLYNKMVSTRPSYILSFLKKGINLIYADIDSVWLKNPLLYFEGNFDVLSQMDAKDYICTGFLAILSNIKTIEVVQKWKDAMNLNQSVVNQPMFNTIVRKSPVTIKALDSRMFPSGKQYFEVFSKEERSRVVIVHNNWIIGHDKKVERFKNVSLWANVTAP